MLGPGWTDGREAMLVIGSHQTRAGRAEQDESRRPLPVTLGARAENEMREGESTRGGNEVPNASVAMATRRHLGVGETRQRDVWSHFGWEEARVDSITVG
jgi:hypothetical protein